MKRAIEAHEATYISINVIILRSIVNKYPQDFADISRDIFTITKMARNDIFDDTINLEISIDRIFANVVSI